MTVVHRRARAAAAAALIAGTLGATAACDTDTRASASSSQAGGTAPSAEGTGTPWEEPAAYTYTLRSDGGERPLIGAFRITVRDHRVIRARGLDESGRFVVRRFPDMVPTVGGLLAEMEKARRDGADVAEGDFAPDGRPRRITIDQDRSAIDDEAEYVISGFTPAADRGR
ncbi:DUF6174 domain-containing protein [Streptomyces sp. NPDC093094]|uniref:DUF6174 domain-containing protein n=1 Tax=Streptomyces sp. NPDC093094 TaxID=3366026 RepID=UPI0038162608